MIALQVPSYFNSTHGSTRHYIATSDHTSIPVLEQILTCTVIFQKKLLNNGISLSQKTLLWLTLYS